VYKIQKFKLQIKPDDNVPDLLLLIKQLNNKQAIYRDYEWIFDVVPINHEVGYYKENRD